MYVRCDFGGGLIEFKYLVRNLGTWAEALRTELIADRSYWKNKKKFRVGIAIKINEITWEGKIKYTQIQKTNVILKI